MNTTNKINIQVVAGMTNKILIFACGALSLPLMTNSAIANLAPVANVALTDENQAIEQAWQQTKPAQTAPTTPTMSTIPTMSAPPATFDDPNAWHHADLLTLEEAINQALWHEQWAKLNLLLNKYAQLPNHDPMLLAYAQGAIFRQEGKQKQAIAQYQNILSQQANLPYIKLDLALMLFEDKQYNKAKALMEELLMEQTISVGAQNIVQQAHAIIKDSQALKPSIALNYESTDNVNHASSKQEIVWLGQPWQKDPSSLPQKAHGIRYEFNLQKDTNIDSNHYALMDLSAQGVHYFDKSEYNESSLRLSAGYKYQDHKRIWRLLPFVEQNWFNQRQHNRILGIGANYGQSINQRDYWQLQASSYRKFYNNDNQARHYNGQIFHLGTTINHRLNQQSMAYGGFGITLDNTRNLEYASKTLAMRAGFRHAFINGLGLNAHARYAVRVFNAPSSLPYRLVRADDEYQAGLSFWHQKITWRGLRPQVNIRYTKIDSNMPALHSRDDTSYFMSIEKAF